MAGKGPKPSDRHVRERDTRRRTDDKAIKIVGSPEGGEPPKLPDGCDWHPFTYRWWESWRTNPIVAVLTDTDWVFLLDTALIADSFYRGDLSKAAELRLRVAKYGATVEDRARLRLQFIPEGEKKQMPRKPATARQKASRRKALED